MHARLAVDDSDRNVRPAEPVAEPSLVPADLGPGDPFDRDPMLGERGTWMELCRDIP